MKKFEILPHTADLRLKIEGDTMEELFLAGVSGMAEIIKKSSRQNNGIDPVQIISVKSPDQTALLIDFLSEILTITQTQKTIIYSARFLKLTGTEAEAEIFGKKVEKFDKDIKAVTYHEANIIKNKDGNFETLIVFDI